MEQPKEYFAFISYQRRDEKWAKWLADKLEHYHLPTTLNGKDLPKNLRPVFRDVDELSAGNLPTQIYHALSISKNLIVVCSPHSAQSEWVNKEITDFIKIKGGKADNIYPFVIDGVPFSKDDDKECFPVALRNLPGNEERLGGNINEQGGREAAVVKIIAGMLGIGFDSLWQKYEREKKKKRNWRIIAVIMAFLCISCIAFSMYMQNMQTQRANRKMKENQIRFIAEKAMMLVDEGDSYTARLLALSLLPENVELQAYLPEAEAALRHADAHNSAVLKGHTAAVNMVCYNKDGTLIGSASYDHTVKLWNAQTGECLKTFYGHKGMVYDVDFFSNDNKFITFSDDKIVKIWDIKSGHLIKDMNKEEDKVSGYLLSPDKQKFILLNKKAYLYSSETLEALKTIDDADNWIGAVWHPDGKSLYVYTVNRQLCRIEISTGGVHLLVQEQGDEPLLGLATSPDGKRIAGAFGNHYGLGYVKIWDAEKGHCLQILKDKNDWTNGITFSPDGKMLVSTSMNGEVRLWEVDSGICLDVMKGHSFASGSPCFSPDGNYLATSSADNTIRIWDMRQERKRLNNKVTTLSVSFNPNGNRVILLTQDSISEFDVNSMTWQFTLPQSPVPECCATYSEEGAVLAAAYRADSLYIWNSGGKIGKGNLAERMLISKDWH